MTSAKIKVLITGDMSDEGLLLLRKNENLDIHYAPALKGPALHEELRHADALVIRTNTIVDPRLLAHAPRLRLVCRAGIGLDNVDLKACEAKNIKVVNTPAANRISTAEHALALLLALAKQIPRANQTLHEGRWEQKSLEGIEVSGKRLTIVGLGNIGQRVAPRAQAFGLDVVACDPYLNPDVARDLHVPLLPLHEANRRADFVTLHVPLTDETRGLADRDFFASMKAGSFFINTSRGAVVDEGALAEALKSGHLAGAALDVFVTEPLTKENPLRQIPQVILTPHVAGKSFESQVAMSMEAAQAVMSYFNVSP